MSPPKKKKGRVRPNASNDKGGLGDKEHGRKRVVELPSLRGDLGRNPYRETVGRERGGDTLGAQAIMSTKPNQT